MSNKSSQESSPITQWQEKVQGIVSAIQKNDFTYFVVNHNGQSAPEALTSATIELAQSLIGEDEPVPETAGEIMSRKAIELEERRDKCKVCAKVAANEVSWQRHCRRHIGESWRAVKQTYTTPTGLAKSRNNLREELRQSLKEL